MGLSACVGLSQKKEQRADFPAKKKWGLLESSKSWRYKQAMAQRPGSPSVSGVQIIKGKISSHRN